MTVEFQDEQMQPGPGETIRQFSENAPFKTVTDPRLLLDPNA